MNDTTPQYILGLWDGHDAGAALVQDDRIVVAVNEERLSRRKLDATFPRRSIIACLEYAGLRADAVGTAAYSTSDFAKTLSRCFPSLRENYYLFRRRKKSLGSFAPQNKSIKYLITEWPAPPFGRRINGWIIRRELSRLGLRPHRLIPVDHHAAHAAPAAFCSGFIDGLVLTLDGIGDGLAGSLWSFQERALTRLADIPGHSSFGIFFEQVTYLLNMRELEDEGKVMALANFAAPVPDSQNPLMGFIAVQGTDVRAQYGSIRMYRELRRILWRYPLEQFAFMAQRVLEVKIVELIRNALHRYGHRRLCYAGGVASNVKVNLLIREMPEVKELFVLPHMGDGGLAVGAALWSNYKLRRTAQYALPNVFLGPGYDDSQIAKSAGSFPGIRLVPCPDVPLKACEAIMAGNIILWFQGRMELGPRALGGRSILALPNSAALKNRINLSLKRRAWYQPFCPTLLHEDALECLEGYQGPPNRFMTCAYRVREDKRSALQGVINVDGTCRPQILESDGTDLFICLLQELKRRTGLGAVLNTSFNFHGEPMVCSPEDAFATFVKTDLNHLFIGSFMAVKDPPVGKDPNRLPAL